MGIDAYKEGQYRYGKKQERAKQRFGSLEELNARLGHRETSLDENTDQFINALTKSFDLRARLGIVLNEDGSVPSTEGTPRMFIIERGEDGNDRMASFEEAGIEYGSRDFWKQAQLGKVYAYPAGERYPVQLSLSVNGTSPRISVSGLQEPRHIVPENDIERPGFFQRLLHSLNKNWASQDTRDYYEKEARASRDEAFRSKLADISDQRGRGAGHEVRAVREKEEELLTEVKKQEAQEHADALEKALYEKQHGLKTYRDLTAPTPVFDPEREKIVDEAHPKSGLYTREDFNKLEKIDVKLTDLKIGGEPISEEAYMGLVASCSSSPEFVEEVLKDAPSYDPTLVPTLQRKGFSRDHILKSMAANFTDWTYGDFMRIDELRDGESNMFGSAVNNGRRKAVELLQAYQKGEPGSRKALAEHMTTGMKAIAHPGIERRSLSEHYLKQCRVMSAMSELFEKDPELKKTAMEECGLTEEEYKSVKGMGLLDKADLKAAAAGSALANAAIGKGPALSEEQKKQYAADILEARLIETRFTSEVAMDNDSPELKDVDKQIDTMMEQCVEDMLIVTPQQAAQWSADPSSRPLPPEGKLYSDQIGPCKHCMLLGKLKVNGFAKELGEKGSGEIRSLAEAIVEREGLAGLSAAELDKKLSGAELKENGLLKTAGRTAEALKAGKQAAAAPDDPELGGNLNIDQEMKSAGRGGGIQL